MEKTVKRYSLSKQVADQLEQLIAAGEYPVDKKIPTETELMDIFKVSRNTIREAVGALTSAGVLDVRQGDGTYVRAKNRFNAQMKMKYADTPLSDITEVRNAMEVTIAHLAAERRTEDELVRIARAHCRRAGLKETIKENTVADVEFHMAIAEACHNKMLIDLYRSIYSYLESYIAERHQETDLDIAAIDRLHEELYLAIRDQKPEEAYACAKKIVKI